MMGIYTVTTSQFSINLSLTSLKIIGYFLFSRFWVVASIWVLFLTSQGYSLSTIAILDSGYFVAIFLFEIPTGMIADRFGRKTSILFSLIAKAGGIFWLAFAPSGLHIFVAFAIWGIGMTLSSGAEEAWLYDEIEASNEIDNQDRDYQKIYGIMISIGLISTAGANFLGGLIFDVSPRLPLILTSLAFVIALIIILSIPETTKPKEKQTVEKTKFALAILRKPEMILLATVSISIGALISSVIYWMQPYLDELDITTVNIGLVLGIGIIAASIGSSINSKISSLLGQMTLPSMIFGFGIGFFLLPRFGIWLIVVFFLLVRFIRGIFNPVMSNLFNNSFDKSYRATALSIISGLTTLSIALVLWISGNVIDNYSFNTYFNGATIVIFGITLPASLIYSIKLANNKVNVKLE